MRDGDKNLVFSTIRLTRGRPSKEHERLICIQQDVPDDHVHKT